MSEWLSYRPSDFVLFSANSYWRMVEAANAGSWPAPLLGLGLGLLVLVLVLRETRPDRARRLSAFSFGAFAACWAWVGWHFLSVHYASINWAAPAFGLAFAAEAALLALCAATVRDWRPADGARRTAGVVVLAVAVVGYPLLGVAAGRPWSQVEAFGATPDPTALATIGLLLVVRLRRRELAGLLWPIPLVWLAVSATTLATMR